MADLDENLIAVLEGESTVTTLLSSANSIFVNEVPPEESPPFIWIQLDDEINERDLSGGGGITETIFSVECVAESLDVAKNLQKAVSNFLDGYEATTNVFGDQNIASIEAIGKNDQYEPRSIAGLTGDYHVGAITLEIITDGR